ncbi:Angiotensin-converting enzyme 2 [Bertholletia excelsa]
MGESTASYIHMVQHLIEECILFNMSREECVEALSKHANIKPVITSTVWKELEKENKEFFESYAKRREEKSSEMERRQRIHKMRLDSSPGQGGDTPSRHD